MGKEGRARPFGAAAGGAVRHRFAHGGAGNGFFWSRERPDDIGFLSLPDLRRSVGGGSSGAGEGPETGLKHAPRSAAFSP